MQDSQQMAKGICNTLCPVNTNALSPQQIACLQERWLSRLQQRLHPLKSLCGQTGRL